MIALPALQLRWGQGGTLCLRKVLFLSLDLSLERIEPRGFLLVQKLYLTQAMFTLFFMPVSIIEHPLQSKWRHR